MQISANNLLIASQQVRAAQPAKPAMPAFEPLPLRRTAPDTPAAAAPTQTAVPRPGSQLDIRV
jgi:hypothetical protein